MKEQDHSGGSEHAGAAVLPGDDSPPDRRSEPHGVPVTDRRQRALVVVVLLLLTAAIFCLHRGGYWLIKRSLPPGTEMSFVAAAGDQGYTIDLATYGAAIREAVRHPSLFRGDPYEIEHKRQYLPKGAVSLALAGLPMVLTGDVEDAFWWGQLIPIAASIVLLWVFLGLTGGTRDHGTLAILLFVVPWILLANTSLKLLKRMLHTLVAKDLPAIRDFWYLGRFPFIEVAVVFLLIWLVCLAYFLVQPSTRSALMLGGALAILQYSYFYHVTGALVMTACCLVLSWSLSRRWRLIASALAAYVILIVPFLVNVIKFLQSPYHQDYVLNSGRETLGALRPNLWMIALALVFLAVDCVYLVFVRKENCSVRKVLRLSSLQLGLFLTYVVVTNIQMVLGWTMQPSHWKVAFYMPVLGAILGMYLVRIRGLARVVFPQGFQIAMTVGLVSGAIVIGIAGVGTAFTFASQWQQAFTIPPSEAGALRYLEENCRGAVIASNSLRLNLEIAAKVGNPVLFGNAVVSACDLDELTRRFVLGFRAAGYDKTMIVKQLKLGEDWVPTIHEWRQDPTLHAHGFFQEMLENRCSLVLLGDRRFYVKGIGHRVPQELIRKVDELCRLPLQDLAAPLALDYVVFDRRIVPGRDMEPHGTVVYENKDFLITKFRTGGPVPSLAPTAVIGRTR